MSLSRGVTALAMAQEQPRGPALTTAWDELDAPTIPPPRYATLLFDGSGLSNWVALRGGGPAQWTVKDGYLEVAPRTGDVHTKAVFTDFQLHVEFWLPLMETARGQAPKVDVWYPMNGDRGRQFVYAD